MWLLLAALSAVCYGAADFCGGLSARHAPVLATIAGSQLCGLALAAAAAPLVGPNAPAPADLAWGAAAGLCGAAGLAVFYRALASTVISVASPAAAVSGAALPVLFGLLLGERPSIWAWAGLPVALVAIGALSSSGSGSRRSAESSRALPMGLLSGLGFGGFFIAVSRAAPASGLWPLVAARLASLAAVFAVSLLGRRPVRLEPGARGAAALAGLLDMAANIFYLLAARAGLLALVAVLVSLYAAPTVLLARLVLGERLSRWRLAGLVLAVASVALMSFP